MTGFPDIATLLKNVRKRVAVRYRLLNLNYPLVRKLKAPLKKGRKLAAKVKRRRFRVKRLTKLVKAYLRLLFIPKR